VTRTAVMAAATIKTVARIERMMSFLLVVAEDEEGGSLVRGVVERREEPPGSLGPNLPYSIGFVKLGVESMNESVSGFLLKWEGAAFIKGGAVKLE